MAFTPKIWEDFSAGNTPVEGTQLTDLESRVYAGALADVQTLANMLNAQGQSANLLPISNGSNGYAWGTGSNGLVIGANNTDTLGRTQVLGTTSIKAPALKQIVAVTDNFSGQAGAAGDAQRIADGATTAGSNVLHSAGAYAIGQSIEVVGAAVATSTVNGAGQTFPTGTLTITNTAGFQAPGTAKIAGVTGSVNYTGVVGSTLTGCTGGSGTATNGGVVTATGQGAASNGNLFGTVTGVGTNTATLSVTAWGTVSSAIVTFGTNDTAAFNNAHSVLSAAGGGTLLVPANRSYMLGKVTMKSNVNVQAQGATFYLTSQGSNNSGFQVSTVAGDAAISNWSIRGGTFIGDGAYLTGNKVPIFCDVVGSTDIRVEDNQFFNFGDGAIGLYVARCWVNRNYLNGIVLTGSRNAINIEASGAAFGQSTDIEIDGNILTNVGAHAIHFGTNGGNSLTIWDLRISISNNKVYGATGPAIACEIGDDGTGFGFSHGTIHGNIVDTNPGTGGIALGVSTNVESTNQRFAVTGNVITLTGVASSGIAGINLGGNDIAVVGNVINIISGLSTTHGISVTGFGQSVTATLDGSTNVITNVVVPAGGTPPANGDFLTGTGITTGTYIVSGASTSTWTLSQVTTVPGSGVALNAQVCSQNVIIATNVIHMPNVTAGNGININNLAEGHVVNNNVYFDPGAGSNATYCMNIVNTCNSSFVNNRLTNSPRFGIQGQQLHDCDFTLNKIHNPNQNGAAAQATSITNSTNIDIDFNRIWDDTPATIATTVSGAGQTFPTGSLTVSSTVGFGSGGGTMVIAGITGTVTYTGTSGGNTITGCTGGTGTATNGGIVIASPTVTSKITQAITPGATGSSGFRARGNRIIGATNTSPLSTLAAYSEIKDNVLPSSAAFAPTVAETYPGSTAAFTNTHQYAIRLFIAGGTITVISILTANDTTGTFTTTGQTQGVFTLNPGDQIKCTSTGNPTTYSSQPV